MPWYTRSTFYKIGSTMRYNTLRRLLGSLLLASVLLAVIVPTWHMYTEEGKPTILARHQSINSLGEGLRIEATVLDVDFEKKEYDVHFLVKPNGTIADEFGQLTQPITIGFSSMIYYHFKPGESIHPVETSFSFDFGNEIDYPFDEYSGYFEIWATYTNNVTKSIPISFQLEAGIASYSFVPTLQPLPNQPDHVALRIVTSRSTTTMGFSIFVCILMWALTFVMSLFGCQVAFRKREVDAHGCMLGVTMLFALPALRSAQPGVPDIGCIADVLGFYWNMAIIACACITIFLCWVARWNPPPADHKIESGISEEPKVYIQHIEHETMPHFTNNPEHM